MNLNNKRREFLECARRIVIRDGVAKLTLDAVALEAGVSKGGILYHFPTKNALIADMIRFMFDDFGECLERHLATEPLLPGRWTRAFIRANVDDDSLSPESGAAILAAIGNDPMLMKDVQGYYEEHQRQLESDGLDPVTVWIVRLAMDGLLISGLLGLALPETEITERVVARLLEMTTPSSMP